MLALVRRTAAVALATISLVQGYANPGACTGACWAHDPSVIQRTSDNLYFKFNTGGSIEIVTASSLTGPWTIKGYVLPNGSKISLAGNKDLWAPDVQKVGNLYHLYYTVSTFGSQNSAIGLATSSTLEPGSWTDQGSVGVTSNPTKNYNAIDANVFQADGNWYMNFGSFWNDIFQVQLNSAATKSSGASYNIEYNSTGSRPSEGSFQFYNSGYYYLLWSSGICCGYNEYVFSLTKGFSLTISLAICQPLAMNTKSTCVVPLRQPADL